MKPTFSNKTPDMFWKPVDFFWYWINERHRIYLNRTNGQSKPWTHDKIFQQYKFTNVFRELDRTTIWMRENLTRPNDTPANAELMIMNCAVFRFFGTILFGESLGWLRSWQPARVQKLALRLLDGGSRIFTGAYMITTFHHAERKPIFLVQKVLTPLWSDIPRIAETAFASRSLESTCNALRENYGFSASGFMAYEVISDLRHTSVLRGAKDVNLWTNAGPGALRGLNRIHERPINHKISSTQALKEMQELWSIAQRANGPVERHVPRTHFEMREIEHSLCEFDKYMRIHNDEGRVKNRYNGGA